MAIINCFTGPDSLQGVLTCLRDSENLTGILVAALLLVGWLAIQYLAEVRRVRQAPSVKAGIPVTRNIPAFGCGQHADAVHSFANREYYQIMLAEMEKALFAAGYELTRDEFRRVTIPTTDLVAISRKIFRARQWYVSPGVSEQVMKDSEDTAVNDGYAGMWLSVLLRGSEREGWYITKPQPEFVPTSFPLKQVAITVRATQAVLTRDVVRIINDIAEKVKTQHFCPAEPVCIATGAVNDELNYEAQMRETDVAPGWFSSPSGCDVPENMTAGQFPSGGDMSGYRLFIVRVQGGRFYTPGTLAFHIEQAASRIGQGEVSGAGYEDDSGYAFTVTPAKSAH